MVSMFVQLFVSGMLYAILGAALTGLIVVLLKSIATTSRRTLFIASSVVPAALAFFLFLQVFLGDKGFSIYRVDPAAYIGYFTINPLKVVSAEYGVSQTLLGPSASFFVGLGFLGVLAAFSPAFSVKPSRTLKAGLFSGMVLVLAGLVYGLTYDALGSSNVGMLVAILALLSYPLAALFVSRSESAVSPRTVAETKEHNVIIVKPPPESRERIPGLEAGTQTQAQVQSLAGKRVSVWLMILLSLVTVGIYPVAWFLNRREALNALQSKTKLEQSQLVLLLIAVIISAAIFIVSLGMEDSTTLDRIDRYLSIGILVGGLMQSFRIRRILLEHFRDNLKRDFSVSGVATFFFQIYYLQHKMNQLVSMQKSEE